MVASLHSPISALIIFAGAQEILGPRRLEQIATGVCLSSPSLPEAWQFLTALEKIYGIPGGQGLAYRIGRAAFPYVLKQIGQEIGLQDSQFHLLPQVRRLENGLRILAREIGRQWGQTITVSAAPSGWLWSLQDCPACFNRQSADPCCHVLAGLLHAYMAWAGGGRYFRITETVGRAAGKPACVFEIEKKALD